MPNILRSAENFVFAGIDVGRTGAIALIDSTGIFVDVLDMPYIVKDGGVDTIAIRSFLCGFNIRCVFIEKQQPYPHQGVKSVFSLGYQFGQIISTIALCNYPYEIVHPKTWQKYYNRIGYNGSKDASIRIASGIVCDEKILQGPRGGSRDGRSDAVLIANFGYILYRDKDEQ